MNNVPPKILKEKVLAVRGGWVVKGRLALYHGDRVRRVELYLEQAEKLQEVGWTTEDLAQLQGLLERYKQEIGEV